MTSPTGPAPDHLGQRSPSRFPVPHSPWGHPSTARRAQHIERRSPPAGHQPRHPQKVESAAIADPSAPRSYSTVRAYLHDVDVRRWQGLSERRPFLRQAGRTMDRDRSRCPPKTELRTGCATLPTSADSSAIGGCSTAPARRRDVRGQPITALSRPDGRKRGRGGAPVGTRVPIRSRQGERAKPRTRHYRRGPTISGMPPVRSMIALAVDGGHERLTAPTGSVRAGLRLSRPRQGAEPPPGTRCSRGALGASHAIRSAPCGGEKAVESGVRFAIHPERGECRWPCRDWISA